MPWCQVWCLDDGYWENVEVTPPAGIEQIQKSVEEMKLPKGDWQEFYTRMQAG